MVDNFLQNELNSRRFALEIGGNEKPLSGLIFYFLYGDWYIV